MAWPRMVHNYNGDRRYYNGDRRFESRTAGTHAGINLLKCRDNQAANRPDVAGTRCPLRVQSKAGAACVSVLTL